MDLWYPYAASIGGTLIDGTQEQAIDLDVNDVVSHGDGEVDPRHVSLYQQGPEIPFSTHHIGELLGVVSLINGAAISGGNAVFFCMKDAAGGARAGTGDHAKTTIQVGQCIIDAIEASQGQPAMARVRAVSYWDGTNAPIALAYNQSLAGTPAMSQEFTLGPVSINGSALPGVQRVRIEPGIVLPKTYSDGDVFPTRTHIRQRRPRITIDVLDPIAALNAIGSAGTAQGATDSLVFLRAKSNGAANVANATTSHLSVGIAAGKINVVRANFTNGNDSQGQVVITPVSNGSDAILVVGNGVAIS